MSVEDKRVALNLIHVIVVMWGIVILGKQLTSYYVCEMSLFAANTLCLSCFTDLRGTYVGGIKTNCTVNCAFLLRKHEGNRA